MSNELIEHYKVKDKHRTMKYSAGDGVYIKKNYKGMHSDKIKGKICTINGIRIWEDSESIPDYKVEGFANLCLYDDNIDHEATEQLNKKSNINFMVYGRPLVGRSQIVNFTADLLNCKFEEVKPKRLIPYNGDQYFYIDLADPNLFGVATWLNDDTDSHMLKLGLIKDTPQECVKTAKEMLKKLGLEL